MTPFPFRKKLGNIVYNGFGKFFCFIIENNNRELPSLIVYDVRKVFPQFDKYHLQIQEIENQMQMIDGVEIRKATEVCNDTIMVEGFVDLTQEAGGKKKKRDKEMKELKDLRKRK